NEDASGLIFSPDSRSLFFTSNAIDLTSNPLDAGSGLSIGQGFAPSNLFVRDLSAGTTSLISATTAGELTGGWATNELLSPDGQTLYFVLNTDNTTTNHSNPPTAPIVAV